VIDIDETLVFVGIAPPDSSWPAPDYTFPADSPLASASAWLRPHAAAFVDFCFRRFENVSLWTHASPAYRPMVEALFARHAGRWAFDGCACLRPRPGASGRYDQVQRPCPFGVHAVGHGPSFVWFGGRKTRRTVCSACARPPHHCHRAGCKPTGGEPLGFEPTAAVQIKRLSKIWRSTRKREAGWRKHSTLIVDDSPEKALDNYGNAVTVSAWEPELWDGSAAADPWQDGELERLRGYLDSGEVRRCQELHRLDKRGWRDRAG